MRKAIFALMLLVAMSAQAQTNLQFHYDFGKNRNYVTTTLEMFKPDKWGNTFFFVDFDYNMGEKNHPSSAYMEIARCLKFWNGPLSLHVEYNGGFGTFNAPASVRRVESDGSVTTILNWSYPFAASGCFGGAASHTGYWVTRSSTTHTVSHWDRATLTFNSDITLPLATSNTYIGFATVVAPEPATMFAIGLSALALRKRRQK